MNRLFKYINPKAVLPTYLGEEVDPVQTRLDLESSFDSIWYKFGRVVSCFAVLHWHLISISGGSLARDVVGGAIETRVVGGLEIVAKYWSCADSYDKTIRKARESRLQSKRIQARRWELVESFSNRQGPHWAHTRFVTTWPIPSLSWWIDCSIRACDQATKFDQSDKRACHFTQIAVQCSPTSRKKFSSGVYINIDQILVILWKFTISALYVFDCQADEIWLWWSRQKQGHEELLRLDKQRNFIPNSAPKDHQRTVRYNNSPYESPLYVSV